VRKRVSNLILGVLDRNDKIPLYFQMSIVMIQKRDAKASLFCIATCNAYFFFDFSLSVFTATDAVPPVSTESSGTK